MSSKRRAVHFGAGNIGRGFLGQLYAEGGYQIVFVDANAELIAQLNARGAYPLRLVSNDSVETLTVGGVSAIDVQDGEAIGAALAEADIVGVSVGVAHLPQVAPVLAAGVQNRLSPLDILLCENQWHAAAAMREFADFPAHIGLVETVIGRMVPAPTEAVRAEDPLLVVAEPYKELPVARAMLRAPAPTLPGLILADNFDAYEARKLFLHNMSHAALAYIGHGADKRMEYIWERAAEPFYADMCRQAMAESSAALVAEYGFAPADLQAFSDDLLRRYANKALGDTIARVAADPLRKLRPNDRLVGAANLCLKHNIKPNMLALVILRALDFVEWIERQRVIAQFSVGPPMLSLANKRKRLETMLQNVCGLAPNTELAQLVLEKFDNALFVSS